MFDALLTTFAIVLIAELGDKTQLLVLVLAAKHKAWHVLAGVALGSAVIHLASVAGGSLLGEVVPQSVVSVGAGLLFVAFGVWTFIGKDDGEEEEVRERGGLGPVLGIAVPFMVAEFGDKTQLATLTLAARFASSDGFGAVSGVWLGAIAGMVVASTGAVVVGSLLGKKLPQRALAIGSAVLFVAFGAWMIAEGLLG